MSLFIIEISFYLNMLPQNSIKCNWAFTQNLHFWQNHFQQLNLLIQI